MDQVTKLARAFEASLNASIMAIRTKTEASVYAAKTEGLPLAGRLEAERLAYLNGYHEAMQALKGIRSECSFPHVVIRDYERDK